VRDAWGGALAKIVETTCDKKIGSNIFIIDKFCKKRIYNVRGFKIVKNDYMYNTITYNGIFYLVSTCKMVWKQLLG